MLEYFIFLAAFASLLAALAYIHSMFKSATNPNRVTWLMWSIAPLIAAAAAISNGVGWAVLPVFMAGFSPLLIFTASFFAKKAYWKLSKIEYLCGALSASALALWYITDDPNIAIVLAIVSDGFAAIPTLRKAWNHPETESAWPFIVGVFSPAASFAAAVTWTFSELAFPIYLIVINILLVSSVYNKRLEHKNKTSKQQDRQHGVKRNGNVCINSV
jgi:hypothetical protein